MEDTPPKRFQLMQRVNPEGLYLTLHACLPHLKREGAGRIVVVSPPIYSRFFRGKTAYAMGKVGMSVLTKGLAMDFARQGLDRMAITSIWPAVVCSLLYCNRVLGIVQDIHLSAISRQSNPQPHKSFRRQIQTRPRTCVNPPSSQMRCLLSCEPRRVS